MSTYSMADVESGLPGVIDKALAGDRVIITRDGTPVAELRSLTAPATDDNGMAWLRARRETRPSITISSVELLRQVYGEDD